MSFHYWTQPLPNPLSCFFHRMPQWMHRMETYATFVHECLCSLFVFAPLYLRIIAFAGFQSLMLIINLTGTCGAQLTELGQAFKTNLSPAKLKCRLCMLITSPCLIFCLCLGVQATTRRSEFTR